MAPQGCIPGGREKIEQRHHRERRHEHDVVDRGGVAGEGLGDDVADQGHDEEGPYELDTSHDSEYDAG